MTPGLTTGSTRRVWGLMYRHLALYRHSWPRLLELMYWPVALAAGGMMLGSRRRQELTLALTPVSNASSPR